MFLKSNLPYFFSWKQPELRLYVAKTLVLKLWPKIKNLQNFMPHFCE